MKPTPCPPPGTPPAARDATARAPLAPSPGTLSATGAATRRGTGSKGATVFRDPPEPDRVWVMFDWDEQGWQSFVSDPEVPPIMKEAGHKGKPQAAQFAATALERADDPCPG